MVIVHKYTLSLKLSISEYRQKFVPTIITKSYDGTFRPIVVVNLCSAMGIASVY